MQKNLSIMVSLNYIIQPKAETWLQYIFRLNKYFVDLDVIFL